MAGHLVPLAAFLVQPKPRPLAMLEIVSDPHRHRRADPGEAVDHDPDQRPVAQSDQCGGLDRVQQLARLLGGEHRRLAALDHVLGPAHRTCRVGLQNPAGGQVVEQLPDGGQVLLDRGLRRLGAELLDVGGDAERLDLVQLELALVAPVEELFHRARVGHARVAVADVGGEELDEAAAGAFALGADNGRQRVQAGADQRRRRHDLVG